MDFDKAFEKIQELKVKHNLVDFQFDTECIYGLGDLTALLTRIVKTTLPHLPITITERHDEDATQFVATVTYRDVATDIHADDFTDWLPDAFDMEMQQIPVLFNTGLLYYSINPAIGFTGQDAWYFCGTEANLKAARKAGIPLIFPGEHPLETEEFKLYNE